MLDHVNFLEKIHGDYRRQWFARGQFTRRQNEAHTNDKGSKRGFERRYKFNLLQHADDATLCYSIQLSYISQRRIIFYDEKKKNLNK